MNTKVLTYGIGLIAVGLVVVFVGQDQNNDLTASIPLPSSSNTVETAKNSPTVSIKDASAGMVTPGLSPSVLVTVSPISTVSPSLSPKPPAVSPILSPSISPAIPAQLTPTAVSPSPMVTVSPTSIVSPSLSPSFDGLVVVSEIAWMGTEAQSNDEWIELYNAGSQAIDLNGWKLQIAGDTAVQLSGIIRSHEYYLLERTSGDTVRDVQGDYVGPLGRYGLNNDGETISLINALGTVVDHIDCKNGWFSGVGSKESRATMERKNPKQSGNTKENWGVFTGSGTGHDASGAIIRGTPRARNSVHTE